MNHLTYKHVHRIGNRRIVLYDRQPTIAPIERANRAAFQVHDVHLVVHNVQRAQRYLEELVATGIREARKVDERNEQCVHALMRGNVTHAQHAVCAAFNNVHRLDFIGIDSRLDGITHDAILGTFTAIQPFRHLRHTAQVHLVYHVNESLVDRHKPNLAVLSFNNGQREHFGIEPLARRHFPWKVERRSRERVDPADFVVVAMQGNVLDFQLAF